MPRLLLTVACLVLLLTACRLDVVVEVDLDVDGTGVVRVTATADAELVAMVPDLADELVFDDAVANGWVVEGPTPTDDGGLTAVLTHEVTSAEELANVLSSIGPPFSRMAAARTTVGEQTTNAVAGVLVLPDGFASFADADLVVAVGGVPFADEIAAAGADPATSMSVILDVSLPGEIVESTGVETDEGTYQWTAPLDGSSVEVEVETVQRPPPEESSFAGPLATAALVALVLWIALSVTFITFVVIARRRRARRRRRRPPRRPEPTYG